MLAFGSGPLGVLKTTHGSVVPVAGGAVRGAVVLESPPCWCHSPADLRVHSSLCFTVDMKDFGVRSH